MAEKGKLSPVMQQYVDMKAENPDALLMFRLGDFYEAFFDDAKEISNALSLVLTARGTDADGGDIPMCGIPWHAADNYFGRLVRIGYKVALVEQMETPAEAKARGHKYIERKVVRVLTPGTLTDESLLAPKTSNFLVALVPVTGARGVFDIAGCDISTGEFFIGHTDNALDDLVRIAPAEVIYPETAAEDGYIETIRNTYKTTPVYEKLYNRADIGQIVSRVFGSGVDIPDDGARRDDAPWGAVPLLAGYLFNTQRDARVVFRAPYLFKSGRQLLIDYATWRSLEIDEPINENGLCLMDVLDRTRTAAGARRLRAYMRTLSADVGEIRRRQEHIGHLMLNPDIMGGLQQVLNKIPDVGRALSRLQMNRGTPGDLRRVVNFMVALPSVVRIGIRLDSGLAPRFEKINTQEELAGKLRYALSDELPTFFRDGGVIRTGYDVALDNMRGLSHGGRETIAALQAEYAATTGISTLKIKYNNILGYFIEVPSTKAEILMKPDSGFIHRQTMAGNMRFTTTRLIDLDNEVRSAGDKAAAIEADIISGFISEITMIAHDLMDTADLIADADVWYALAECASVYSWARPEITDDTSYDVRGGRHPVIEHALRRAGDNFVKNDCVLDGQRVAVLTGPNMAGKSTYLRQNAILVVLAHLGSFVPATSARIGICDQLFSRVGASDNLAAGQSTFMVEMTETANILNRASNQSFIIFDEIGRGTATYDGMAIATAVLEYLNELGPRTLFATHYHELTARVGNTPGKLNNAQCLTIDVREHNNEIVFMHKIVPGVANRSYGIQVAKMAGMPESVVARATAVLDGLETSNRFVATHSETTPQPTRPGVAEKTPADKPQLNLFG